MDNIVWHSSKERVSRLFAQGLDVLVVDVDVDVNAVVVVSQPLHVLSHCFGSEADDEHSPVAKTLSHVAWARLLTLPAHLSCFDVVITLFDAERLTVVDAG